VTGELESEGSEFEASFMNASYVVPGVLCFDDQSSFGRSKKNHVNSILRYLLYGSILRMMSNELPERSTTATRYSRPSRSCKVQNWSPATYTETCSTSNFR
jgi:hypothetical protein